MKYPIILLITLIFATCHTCKAQIQEAAAYPIEEQLDEWVYNIQQSHPELDSLLACIPINTGYPKPKGYTFAVDEVEKAVNLLASFPAQAVIQQKVGKQLVFTAPEYRAYGVAYTPNNGLLATVHTCYATHRPLILTPDAIWLTICQGVSLHINQHFELLEPAIFKKNKPKQISVREDGLLSEPDAWVRITDSFAQEANRYTNKGMNSLFAPTFSTTSKVEQTAYTVTMLEAFEKAFKYTGEMGCGIPSITIAGTKEDWEQIYTSLDSFRMLDLDVWINNLQPIIKEFIAAADGKPNVVFWQNIYKDATDYLLFYVSGWIVKFYPYTIGYEEVVDEDSMDEAPSNPYIDKLEQVYIPNSFIADDRYLLSTLQTNRFPSGISKIEVVVNNHFEEKTSVLEVYAGFMGMKQYADKSLEPFISWAVCSKDAPTVEYAWLLLDHTEDLLTHKSSTWYPLVVDNARLLQQAIYAPNRCSTPKEGKELLVATLKESLSSYLLQHKLRLKRIELTFILSSSSTAIDVKLTEPADSKELTTYIKQLLNSLPEQWQPATTYASELFDYIGSESDELLNVNSEVQLTIEL